MALTHEQNPMLAKVWVSFLPTGSINGDYGVTSITDTGPGDWTVNFDTNFANTNYSVIGSVRPASDSAGATTAYHYFRIPAGTAPAAASCRVTCFEEFNNGLSDPTAIYVAFFGDLA